ncbi:MAG: sigma-70 family RNA polymerase sigma factor [Candidatus Aminicenantes bacterium]|nr:sigma-70 family RNA polymerase sigma factor [Candidatus Aminicenantes bacterium]
MPRPRPEIDLDAVVAHFRPIIGFKIRRALGWQNPDWEDLTNEVLAQTIAKVKAGEFRGDSKIGTFIYTITCRRIVDYIREKSKIAPRFPEEIDVSTAQNRLEEEERLRDLTAAVAALPPKYREVLDLFYYREMSREETALRLGITPAQVSERVYYACKLLQKSMRRAAMSFSSPSPD